MYNLNWVETINDKSKDIQASGIMFDYLIEVDNESITSYFKPKCVISLIVTFLAAPITVLLYARPQQYILSGTDSFEDILRLNVNKETLIELMNKTLRLHQKEAEELEETAIKCHNSYSHLIHLLQNPVLQTMLGVIAIFVIFLLIVVFRII